MADPSAAQRKAFAKMGIAMPDGSYYIRNANDLSNAIKAVGRTTTASGEEKANEVRRHIMKRANALHLSNQIPDTWNSDGSLKHEDPVDEFLKHFGVKGMKWGVRRGVGTPRAEEHSDSAKANELKKKVASSGTKSLSNDEFETLLNRLNLESRYSKLTESEKSTGEKLVKELLVDTGKQEAKRLIAKGAQKGVEHLVSKIAA